MKCGAFNVLNVPGGGMVKDDDFVDAVDVQAVSIDRIKTGEWWDDAFNGGIVPTATHLFGGSPGAGKAVALSTPIPTPNGWTTMGELAVGDQVFDENGEVCDVIACSPVHRGRQCYAVTFVDGEQIVADSDHLWRTKTKSERTVRERRTRAYLARRRGWRKARGGSGKGLRKRSSTYNPNLKRVQPMTLSPNGSVRTTMQVRASLKAGVHLNHSIDCARPLVLPSVPFEIDPYMLGVWLGDGSTAGGDYCTADSEITESVRRLGYRVHEIRKAGSKASKCLVGGLITQLKRLGVYQNKHIPSSYLRASTLQRLSLLQGLMDTDGYVTKDGYCNFDTTLPSLRDDVSDLLSSLGIKHTIMNRRSVLYGVDHGPNWRFGFITRLAVCRLTRKSARLPAQIRSTSDKHYVKDVRRVRSVPVKCISVNSPTNMYLAGRRMIPTHNSTFLLQVGALVAKTTAKPTYYISAEQDKGELKIYLDRLIPDLARGTFRVLKKMGAGGSIDEEIFKTAPPGMLILDSITALCGKDKDGQVEVARIYKGYSTKYKAPTFIISHMTKEGDLAGLLTLQHDVDCIASFFPSENERSKYYGQPALELHKYRFGPTHKEWQLVMTPIGLLKAPKEKGLKGQDQDVIINEAMKAAQEATVAEVMKATLAKREESAKRPLKSDTSTEETILPPPPPESGPVMKAVKAVKIPKPPPMPKTKRAPAKPSAAERAKKHAKAKQSAKAKPKKRAATVSKKRKKT